MISDATYNGCNMYIDRSANNNPFPYTGKFYIKANDVVSEDGDLFAETEPQEDTIVLITECDITESGRAFSAGALTASYDVFFPVFKDSLVEIERGMMFEGNMEGLSVVGMVISVGHSQLGGAHAYIKSSEI